MIVYIKEFYKSNGKTTSGKYKISDLCMIVNLLTFHKLTLLSGVGFLKNVNFIYIYREDTITLYLKGYYKTASILAKST